MQTFLKNRLNEFKSSTPNIFIAFPVACLLIYSFFYRYSLQESQALFKLEFLTLLSSHTIDHIISMLTSFFLLALLISVYSEKKGLKHSYTLLILARISLNLLEYTIIGTLTLSNFNIISYNLFPPFNSINFIQLIQFGVLLLFVLSIFHMVLFEKKID